MRSSGVGPTGQARFLTRECRVLVLLDKRLPWFANQNAGRRAFPAGAARRPVMSGLFFIPLGVGDAFSSLSYSSCLALGFDGRFLLIDCPHPVRKMLREAAVQTGVPLDLDVVEAVALSQHLPNGVR